MEDSRVGKSAGRTAGGKALPSPEARTGAGFFFLYAIFGIVSPYLQLLLRGLGYSPSAIGFLLGLFEMTGIAGPLVVSRIVDGNGRYRRTLALCSLLLGAATVPLVLVHELFVTALSLVAFSLGLKSLIPVLDAAVTNMLERARRAKDPRRREYPGQSGAIAFRCGYGLLRSMGSAGFVLVALILQLVPRFDDSPPTVFGICIAAAVCVFGASLLFVPEIDFIPARRKSASGATKAVFDPVFLLGLAVIALNRLSYSPISSFFSLYVKEELGWNAVSGLWAFAAAVEIPFLIFSGKFIRRWGPMKVISISSSSIVLRLLIYALFPNPAGAIAGQFLHSVSYGLFQPAAISFVACSYPPEKRATGLALYLGLGVGLPSFIGSSMGGLIVEGMGYRALFSIFALFSTASIWLFRRNRGALDGLYGFRQAT